MKVKENTIKVLEKMVHDIESSNEEDDDDDIQIEFENTANNRADAPKGNETIPKEKDRQKEPDVQEAQLSAKRKCSKCDFATSVEKQMKAPAENHESQYHCQKGCKSKHTTLRELDDHDKQVHGQAPLDVFSCDKCTDTFNAKHHLRQHVTAKHKVTKQLPIFSCNKCGYSVTGTEDMKNHVANCMEEFVPAHRSRVCRYFARGDCWKGDQCLFAHPDSSWGPNKRNIPACVNGPFCRFLRSGVCRFFHPAIGVQQPAEQRRCQPRYQQDWQQNTGSRWCRHLEDCTRIPNCPFSHYEEDFPKLPNAKNPPEFQDWLEY